MASDRRLPEARVEFTLPVVVHSVTITGTFNPSAHDSPNCRCVARWEDPAPFPRVEWDACAEGRPITAREIDRGA